MEAVRSHQSGCLVCGLEFGYHGQVRNYKYQHCDKSFKADDLHAWPTR